MQAFDYVVTGGCVLAARLLLLEAADLLHGRSLAGANAP